MPDTQTESNAARAAWPELLGFYGSYPLRRSRQNPESPKSLVRKATILCIDDDVVGSTLRQAVLQSAGYRVLIATNATQGLEMAKQHRVDLVLLDYEMPDMHGFAVAALLRGISPKKRIVMLSGHASQALRSFREIDGFISKSMRIDRFVASIARHFERLH